MMMIGFKSTEQDRKTLIRLHYVGHENFGQEMPWLGTDAQQKSTGSWLTQVHTMTYEIPLQHYIVFHSNILRY